MQNVLEVKNLTRKFGAYTAVNNISFFLKEGEIVGLLGINGAGKTTTLQMLLGILSPTAGDITYFGKNLQKHKSEIMEKVNFSSTYTSLPWLLSVKENLTFVSYLYEITNRKERIEKVIELFKLKPLLNKQISQLSAGQQTRVNLAKSFINFPKILLLDEPTASLDVEIAAEIREFLLEQREKFGTSIIITSHNMAEVEEICDRVLFISKGVIIANDTPENLAKSIKTAHIELLLQNNVQDALAFCKEQALVCEIKGKRIKINVKEEDIASLLQQLMQKKIYYDEISIEKPSLEDYFLDVVKKDVIL